MATSTTYSISSRTAAFQLILLRTPKRAWRYSPTSHSRISSLATLSCY